MTLQEEEISTDSSGCTTGQRCEFEDSAPARAKNMVVPWWPHSSGSACWSPSLALPTLTLYVSTLCSALMSTLFCTFIHQPTRWCLSAWPVTMGPAPLKETSDFFFFFLLSSELQLHLLQWIRHDCLGEGGPLPSWDLFGDSLFSHRALYRECSYIL